MFVFKFIVYVESESDFETTLKPKLGAMFRNKRGFSGIYMTVMPAARRKRALDQRVQVGVNFTASVLEGLSANETQTFQGQVADSMRQVEAEDFADLSFALMPNSYNVQQFVSQLQDTCNADGDLCGELYQCANSTCFYECEFLDCGQHGQCYMQHSGDVTQALCRCQSDYDSAFDYEGSLCDMQVLKQKWVAAIASAVCIFVALVLAMIIVCVCWSRRRGDKSEDDGDSDNPYNRTYMVAPKYTATYDNSAFRGDMYVPPTVTDTDLSRFYDPRYDKDDNPWLNQTLSQSSPYVIKRPKISVRPVTRT